LFFAGFSILLFFSAAYTHSPDYWKDKLARVLFLTFPSFLIPFFFFNKKDIKSFLIGSATIFTLVSLDLTINLFRNGLYYFFITDKLGEPNYLIWGSYISYNSLLFLGLLIFSNLNKRKYLNLTVQVLFVFGSILTLFILFVSGARGPSIFFSLMILTMFFISKKRKILYFFIISTIVLSIVMIVINVPKDSLKLGRAERLLNLNLQSSSLQARIERFSSAWQMISIKPVLGYGIGSFSIVSNGRDTRDYPHNIFLEIWCENGIFALFSFSIFIVIIFYKAYEKRRKQFVLPFFLVNILFFLNMMKSESLTEARIFFAYLGLLCVLIFVKQPIVYSRISKREVLEIGKK
jgi:O-antigen ligase